MFSGEFCEISKNTFSYTTHPGLLLSTASTAESIFESVAKQFNDHKHSWDYCMVTGLDNTNVNIAGYQNSSKSRALIKKNPDIAIAVCPFHIYVMLRLRQISYLVRLQDLLSLTIVLICFTVLIDSAKEKVSSNNCKIFVIWNMLTSAKPVLLVACI